MVCSELRVIGLIFVFMKFWVLIHFLKNSFNIKVTDCFHFFLKLHTHFKNIKMGGEESIAYKKVKVKVTQLCPTLYDPMDDTVHGILQTRILEWVAVPFSGGSSQPRD